MPDKKEDTERIKQFRDGSNSWWVGYHHYTLLNGTPTFVCGGIEQPHLTEKLIKYLKQKKLI